MRKGMLVHRCTALPLTSMLLFLFPAGSGSGQVGQVPLPSVRTTPGADRREEPDPRSMLDPMKLQRMREDERHKRLVADTTRLVALSTELKDEVDKASKDELSLDVVRKAAELEKLAHDVKERMKN